MEPEERDAAYSKATRMAIKKFLAEYGNDDDLRPFDRVRHLLGIVESGKKDLGSAHRKYLVEKLKGES
ncbi:MAG: hypothetical protein JRJ77_12205 [Deltaproteobacteria bacterium]|nr:hypothetical protein [Deltaproteobacteria bacterium]